MKIALSWDFDENIEQAWSTPLGLGKAFIKQGYEVDYYAFNGKNCDLSLLSSHADDYDLIFFCIAGPSVSFDNQIQILKKHTTTKIYMECGDDIPISTYHHKRILWLDAIFTLDLRCHTNYVQQGLPSHWLPCWCDDEVFYKIPNVNRQNKCVTSCIGSRPNLTEFSHEFGDRFINKNVWGYDNAPYYNSGSFTYQFARYDELTRRIFEAGGCGNAVITNRVSAGTGIYDLFIEDKDICYFSTPKEALDKMLRLYNDHEYRETLANNIYQKIISHHLVGNRVQQIMKVYNNESY